MSEAELMEQYLIVAETVRQKYRTILLDTVERYYEIQVDTPPPAGFVTLCGGCGLKAPD